MTTLPLDTEADDETGAPGAASSSRKDGDAQGRSCATAPQDAGPGRQRQLQSWLALHGMSKTYLAKSLGVHASMISRIISGERAPKERLRQLMDLGIPQELLPAPSRPPGRPKGSFKKRHPRAQTSDTPDSSTQEDADKNNGTPR